MLQPRSSVRAVLRDGHGLPKLTGQLRFHSYFLIYKKDRQDSRTHLCRRSKSP